jgi:general secretion pathway protein M
MEHLRKLRADLEAWCARLAPRERVMVSLAGVAVALFVVFIAFTRMQRGIAAREAAIDRKTQVLAQIGKLATGYRQVQAERLSLEAKLKGPPLQLMSYVSQTGQRLGIEVNDLRPGPAATPGAGDQVTEETVEINLARLELSRLASLLQELERGPGVVKVSRLALRTRSDDPNAVDATLVVATYRLRT